MCPKNLEKLYNMKFLVGFSICAEDRGVVEEILERIGTGHKISDQGIQNLGPENKSDNYVPTLTVIERDLGWCLQVDGEDQVVGISPRSMEEEYKIRLDKAFEVSSSNTLEEHQRRVKKFFLTLLQLNLGDYSYFSDHDDLERMRAMVAWSFAHPLAILSMEDRESAMSGEYPDLETIVPPKDQMN